MKELLGILRRVRPQFEEGGRFAVLKPVFDALENVLFGPDTVTSVAPYVRDPLDVKRYMALAIVALLPCTLGAVYFFGLRVLAMILVSYMAGAVVEVGFAVVRKEEINEGFLVTGLIFPLILPPTVPLWMVALGVAFGVLFGKELFGGTGRNPFNPALVGRCFLALGYPVAMTSGWLSPGRGSFGHVLHYIDAAKTDAISAATPLIQAKQGSLAGVFDLFVGRVPGCAGETSAVLVILGGLFLIFTRVGNWRIVAGSLASALALAFALNRADSAAFAPALWHVCAGGLLFGTFFMATDPVTSPATNIGKWIYGSLIGAVTILIRNFTGYVEGVMFAILLGNIAAPLLDEIVHRAYFRGLANEE
jgi:Na(+)-translocating NADH:ubiquinone oxidoreductase B subunit